MHLAANELIVKTSKEATAGSLKKRDGSPIDQAEYTKWFESEMVKTELDHGSRYNEFFELVEDIENWTQYISQDTVDEDVNVYYKVNDNGNLMAYIDVKIDAPFTHCMAMWWEWDLDTTEEMTDIDCFSRPSDMLMGFSFRMKMPWPVDDRVGILSMCSYFNRDNHSILGISRDL